MYSTSSNKLEKLCILLAFIIRMIESIAVATQSSTARTLGSCFRIPRMARMYGNLRHFRIPGQCQVKPLDRPFRISTQLQVLRTPLTDCRVVRKPVKAFKSGTLNDHFTRCSTCVQRVLRQSLAKYLTECLKQKT